MNLMSGQISFFNDLGISYSLLKVESNNYSLPCILYTPRMNIAELSSACSFSLSSPIHIGYKISSTKFGNEQPSFFLVNVPVLAQLNFGYKSLYDNEMPFGTSIGLGWAYTFTTLKSNIDGSNTALNGPQMSGSMKLLQGESFNICLGTHLQFVVNKSKSIFYGIDLFYAF